MPKALFKVMYTDKDGKGISTQHVRADSPSEAESKARAPRNYDKVIVRKKEARAFI